ncbi:CUB and sushi domain-containing protein 3-like isoform X2 [Saccostrea echinata]|uniref:CUB and sushi domain-containing protein 3-like isoform X2 n=1 Tax=Saccostrea echinata TaxID=191078 RepID=UPI002A817ACC|nr:CUB and sushi domain-containing protein 3-like isoform X2 [Saccostrea echinata]
MIKRNFFDILWSVFLILISPVLSSGETQNSRLTGYVITSLSPIGFRGCSKECNSYSDCKSFNFNRVHLFCELSYKSRVDAESNLINDQGFVYVDKSDQQENTSACTGKGRRCIPSHSNHRSYDISFVNNCENIEINGTTAGVNSTTVGSTIALQETGSNENNTVNLSFLTCSPNGIWKQENKICHECHSSCLSSCGTIMSPDYPDVYYNYADVRWNISTSHIKVIYLRFVDMVLEGSYDFIEIFDGPLNSSNRILYTDKIPSYIVRSSKNLMIVWFHTDYSIVRKGFKAIYWSF